MAQQDWVNLLNGGPPWQTVQGTQLSTATTATISPQAAGSTPGDFVLPGQPNGLQWYPGMQLRIRARGNMASGGTTSSLTVWLAIGVSGALATALCTTPVIVLSNTSLTALGWRLEADITCSALSISATTIASDGLFTCSDTTAGGGALVTANTVTTPMPWLATAFNTYTGGTAIGLRASLSAAFGNIQCNRFTVEQTY